MGVVFENTIILIATGKWNVFRVNLGPYFWIYSALELPFFPTVNDLMIKTGLRCSGPRIFAFFSVVVVQGPNRYILHYLKVPFAWNFFDELNSTEPLNCKTSERYSVPLGHFLKMRQIQNGPFFGGLPQGRSFNVIEYSQIIYRWLSNFMLINFFK